MVIDFVDFYDLSIDLDDVVGSVLRNLCFSKEGVLDFPEGDIPVLKDDAYERVAAEWDNVTAMLKDSVVMAVLDYYYRGIVDAGEYKEELKEHFGWEYPDWKAPIAKEEYAGKGEITSRPAYNDESFDLIQENAYVYGMCS